MSDDSSDDWAPWACKKCTMENSPNDTRCTACGSTKTGVRDSSVEHRGHIRAQRYHHQHQRPAAASAIHTSSHTPQQTAAGESTALVGALQREAASAEARPTHTLQEEAVAENACVQQTQRERQVYQQQEQLATDEASESLILRLQQEELEEFIAEEQQAAELARRFAKEQVEDDLAMARAHQEEIDAAEKAATRQKTDQLEADMVMARAEQDDADAAEAKRQMDLAVAVAEREEEREAEAARKQLEAAEREAAAAEEKRQLEEKLAQALRKHEEQEKAVAEQQAALYPAHWDKQDANLLLVDVALNTPEAQQVVQRFVSTMQGHMVRRVQRIQNKALWQKFSLECKLLEDAGNATTATMFHGSRATAPHLIYNGQEGFDMRFCTSGCWGIASYFAANASYSHGYASAGDGGRQMFVAQVLVGETKNYGQTMVSLKMPPEIPNAGNNNNTNAAVRRYDSVSAVAQGTPVVMVYGNGKAYPEYLLSY